MMPRETHTVNIAGVKRELPLFEVKPGMRIAILNILGDTELIEVSADALLEKLEGLDYELIITAESKSIPLAHALSVRTQCPYVVLRKSYKPYMGNAIRVETNSITTGAVQTLILDEKDLNAIKGKNVLIIDDVISTGSTLEGMRNILSLANSNIVAEAAIFTEGNAADWKNIISLGNLPLFFDQ